jgi:hypothetical protein
LWKKERGKTTHDIPNHDRGESYEVVYTRSEILLELSDSRDRRRDE